MPWRAMQPDFPASLVGNIMSAYYGGRAEVHIRRLVTQVLYCDFTSMYPTVCALMGLWKFVIAKGMSHRDSTAETRSILDRVQETDLQQQSFWHRLCTIVLVQPENDVFPVRGRYGEQQQFTIGLNYLSSEFPMWFALADCIASKLLTGKISFEPLAMQSKLWPINIMGNSDYRVDPTIDDFYLRPIDLRMEVRARTIDAYPISSAFSMKARSCASVHRCRRGGGENLCSRRKGL
jgi:hypothetical protein